MKRAISQVVAFAASVSAFAADNTGMSSPVDALWNTTSLNWNSGEAWVDGNSVIFGSSASKSVTLDANRTVAGPTPSQRWRLMMNQCA